jgi:hypothetical protein
MLKIWQIVINIKKKFMNKFINIHGNSHSSIETTKSFNIIATMEYLKMNYEFNQLIVLPETLIWGRILIKPLFFPNVLEV